MEVKEVENISDEKKEVLSFKHFEKAIYEMENKQLLNFIRNVFVINKKNKSFLERHFNKSEKENFFSIISYNETYKQLVELDSSTKEYGIARMKLIEEEFDIKSIPLLLTLIVFILPSYQKVLENIGKIGMVKTTNEALIKMELATEMQISSIMLGFAFILLISITVIIVQSKKKVQRAVYFRSLLESARISESK